MVCGNAGVAGRPPPHPLMHRSETVDYFVILSGQIKLVLDEEEVLCEAGDVGVQYGTNHAWKNDFEEPCRIAFVLCDGSFDCRLQAQISCWDRAAS